MATRPDTPPTWATDGGAEITDPGTAKRADGWITGEAPAAGHDNFMKNNHGDYIDFLKETLSGQIAFNNITRTTTEPFAITGRLIIQWLPTQNRWFAARNESPPEVFDSADGITWSSATTLEGTGENSQFIEFGGNVYIGCRNAAGTSGVIYETTTGLASGFSALTPTFAGLQEVRGLSYDAFNSLVIAVGNDGSGNACIETSTTPGGTYTNRETSAGTVMTFVATNAAGESITTNSGAGGVFFRSTNGTTWTLDGGPSAAQSWVAYNTALDLWVIHDSTGQVILSTDGGVSIFQPGEFADVHFILNTPEGIVLFNEFLAATGPGEVNLLRNSINSQDDAYDVETLGRIETQTDSTNIASFSSGGTSTGTYVETGDRTWVWTWDINPEKLVYSKY